MGLELLAGLGLAVAGTGLEVAGAQQSQRAMNHTVEDELNVQAGLGRQAQQAYQNSAAQSTVEQAQGQQQKGQQQAAQLYQQLQSVPLQQQSSIGTGDPVTQARTSEYIGQQNKAGSALQGYSQYGLSQSLKDLLAQEQLKNIGAQSGIYQAALPLQLQQAGQAGAPFQAIGQGLGALGSLGALYGIYNQMNPSVPNTALSPFATQLAAQQGYAPIPTPNYINQFNPATMGSTFQGNPFIYQP